MSKRSVASDQAPAAIGPYSQAVKAGGMLFCSGQIPLDPISGEMVSGGIVAQARRVMENLTAILVAAGCDWSHVVKTTIYLTNLNDFTIVNEGYRSEEHTSELQSHSDLVCRLLLEKTKGRLRVRHT